MKQKKYWQSKENGNIWETKQEAIAEAKELYDYGDPTNPIELEEYYEEIIL